MDSLVRRSPAPRCSVILALAALWPILGASKMANSAGLATDPAQPPTTVPVTSAADQSDVNRYGPFGIYDHRSLYGKGVFPEPFIVDDSDGEVNEFRLDWTHQRGKGQNSTSSPRELEHGNGLWTLELEIPYEYDTSNTYDSARRDRPITAGCRGSKISPSGAASRFSSMFRRMNRLIHVRRGAGSGGPTNSPLSKNTEVVPKVFNDTRVGEHFTLQTVLGYSLLRLRSHRRRRAALRVRNGLRLDLPHGELPLPGVQDFIPMFELEGSTLTRYASGRRQ